MRTMAFERGKSGNPGGRPRKTEEQIKFERRCREIADVFGIDRLIHWLKSDNPTASLAALKEINERGFGKSEAVSYIEANVATQTGSGVDELAGEIAALVPGAAGEGSGTDGAGKVDA